MFTMLNMVIIWVVAFHGLFNAFGLYYTLFCYEYVLNYYSIMEQNAA